MQMPFGPSSCEMPLLAPVTTATFPTSSRSITRLSSRLLVGSVLDPVHDRFRPVAVGAHLCSRSLDVVGGSTKADSSLVEQRPRRAWIAVERCPDAARVHQQRAVRAAPLELLVAVAEQDRPLRLAGEHPFLARLRFGGEALDVGEWRAVADENAVQLRTLRKLVEARNERRAERVARRRQGGGEEGLCARRRLGLFAQPAFD